MKHTTTLFVPDPCSDVPNVSKGNCGPTKKDDPVLVTCAVQALAGTMRDTHEHRRYRVRRTVAHVMPVIHLLVLQRNHLWPGAIQQLPSRYGLLPPQKELHCNRRPHTRATATATRPESTEFVRKNGPESLDKNHSPLFGPTARER